MLSDQRTALLRDIPSLPTLNDSMISELVYTDKSSVGRARSSFEDESDCPQDNEAYEHFGDAVLSYVVTKLIRGSYPRINPGGASVMRSRVIDNKNLAAIASAYGLGGQLSVNSVQPHLRKNDRILAGVFEAFVGGLHAEQGLQAVEEWLSQLLSPFISAEYENCRKELRDVNPQNHSELPQHDVRSEPSSLTNTYTPLQVHDATSPMAAPIGSLAELNEKLSQRKIPDQLKWSEENIAPGQSPTFPIWRLTARYEGDVIGEACATRKKEAKNSAAFLALRNLQSRDVL